VRLYPYDVAPNVDTTGDGVADDGSLSGSSELVAERIRQEIQQRVEIAGIEVLEARITYLAYATEIAAVMLQRQQASAIIDARKMIVDGAVGMVEMALERLNEGGRLVAVVGRGMADANYSKYWNKVREQYTIRANIGIDGENYKKYGTTFDVQIVVIDKTGPQGDQKTLTGYYKDLAEIPQALEGIRNDRNAETERKPGITGNQKPAAPAEAKPEPVRSAVDQANAEAGGERESDRRDHDGRGSRESGSADVQRTGGNEEAVRNARPDERGAVGEQRASEPDSQSGESRAEAEAARRLEELRRADAEAAQKADYARQAEAAQYIQIPRPSIRSVPQPQYGAQTVPQPQYGQQMLRDPFDGE
jgi:hypothetical protein